MESFQRESMIREKIKIERLFVLAEAITTRVAFIFSDNKDKNADIVLQPWDAYPEIFSEERKQYELSDEDRELKKFKETRRKFASEYNKRRQEVSE